MLKLILSFQRPPHHAVKSQFSLYLKRPKGYVSASASIYLRLTVTGKRAEMFTGKEYLPDRWNPDVGLAKGNTEEVKKLNAYLSILQGKLHQYHYLMLATGETIY
jgi:hypothetical protein